MLSLKTFHVNFSRLCAYMCEVSAAVEGPGCDQTFECVFVLKVVLCGFQIMYNHNGNKNMRWTHSSLAARFDECKIQLFVHQTRLVNRE
jgi:hypothetical protein